MSDKDFFKENGFLDNKLYELQEKDLKDREFFEKLGIVDNVLSKEMDEKKLEYKDYIEKELENSTKEKKEVIRKKIQQDYEKGEISEEFYISILKEFFGEREVFKAKLSNIKDDSLEKYEYNSKNNTEEKTVEIENRDI